MTVTISGGTGGGAGALSDLSDVTVTGPAAGQFLRYNGTIFVNVAVDWSDVANKPATFAPAAHQYPWSDLTGVPATFAPAAHTHPAAEINGAEIEAVAGTTYTQCAADHRKWKRTTSASAVAVTIDANVNAAGDEITFQQGAAGAITFEAGAGMTLTSSGSLVSGGEGAVVGIKFLSATEAVLFGHTTAESGGGSGSGDMTAAVYDPTGVEGDAFDRANHTGEQGQSTITGLVANLAAKAAGADLTSHTGNTSNPHGVTKAQVGLGSADNTADADKPVSTAVQAALDAKQPLASILTALAALGVGANGEFLGVASGALAWNTPAGGGGFGDSQTWQDASGSRVHSTWYQNTTGKPIMVFIRGNTSSGTSLFQISPDMSALQEFGFFATTWQTNHPVAPRWLLLPTLCGDNYRRMGEASLMDKGFFHPSRGYWQTIGEPPQAIRDVYPEGTDEVPLKPRADHDWNGTAWVHNPQPVPVPSEATVLQLHDEMDRTHGIDLEAAVGGRGPKALTRFRIANTIKRGDPMVAQLQTALGWTDAQVDALFIAAAAR